MKKFEEFSKHTRIRYKVIPIKEFIDKELDRLEKSGLTYFSIAKIISNWINKNLIGKEVSFCHNEDELMSPFILTGCQYTVEREIRLIDQNGESRDIGIIDILVYMQVKIEVDVVYKDIDPFDEEEWEDENQIK